MINNDFSLMLHKKQMKSVSTPGGTACRKNFSALQQETFASAAGGGYSKQKYN